MHHQHTQHITTTKLYQKSTGTLSQQPNNVPVNIYTMVLSSS